MRRTSFVFALPACVLFAVGLVTCSAGNDRTGGDSDNNGGSGPGPGNGGAAGFDPSGAGGSTGPGGDPKTCAEAAMYKTYIGCDFWPTAVANQVWSIFDYAVVVANAGDEAADVTVTRGNNQVAAVTIQPDSLEKIYLPWIPELKGPDFDTCTYINSQSTTVKMADGAYHLVSTRPVTVYQFSALEYGPQGGPQGKDWSACPGYQCGIPGVSCFSYSNDASLLLPSTAMTGNYRITGRSGWPLANMPAYIAITGTESGTNVTVKLTGNSIIQGGGGIQGATQGGTTTFTLQRGEVAEIFGTADTDLSGSLVQADKPVQTIFGMPCVYIPDDSGACDHIEESVFPAETLGQHYFVTVPSGPNGPPVAHWVRIIGNVNNTQLTYPGGAPPGAPNTLNAGQVVELGQVSQDFEIVGDHEFGVTTFQLGASITDPNGGTNSKGDPAQSHATAVEQYRTKYVFLAPSDYDLNYVDIVMPTDASVTVDGAPIGVNATLISSGYGVARVLLGPGNNGAHLMTATKPVGIQVMGYGSYTSYQYPGGLNLATIAPPPTDVE